MLLGPLLKVSPAIARIADRRDSIIAPSHGLEHLEPVARKLAGGALTAGSEGPMPGQARGEPPAPAPSGWRSVHPSYVKLQRIGAWIAVAVAAALSAPPGAILLVAGGLAPALGLGLAALWLALLAALALLAHFWPPLAYRHLAYRLDERGISIRRGVLWRREINVPRSRVQHTDVNQGPIERGFGLAHIVIHTAGTISASVALEGLSLERAEAMRDYLVGSLSDDAV